MNTSLVNFVHVSARSPRPVPPTPVLAAVCPEEASQGGCALRMFRSRCLPCTNPSIPTFNLLPGL